MKKRIEREKVQRFEIMRDGMSLQDAVLEAGRCLLCHDAPCSKACRAGTDPARFIRQIKFENIKGAARTIRANNVLGYVCAHTCPVDRLCEKECSIQALDRPIDIAGLQRFACEQALRLGLEPQEAPVVDGGRAAVVGGGPAGLACAAELARRGHAVTVIEREDELGGVAMWGVPDYRSNAAVLAHDLRNLRDLGVEARCGVAMDGAAVAALLGTGGFDAVFLSTGLSVPVRLPLLAGFKNVVDHVEFLRAAKRDRGSLDLGGKRVAVIGGGSVALDVAVSAAALGARKVEVICLEGLADLPADEEERELGRTMCVTLRAGCRVTGTAADGEIVRSLKGCEVEPIEPGNFRPDNFRDVPGTAFEVPVDRVVLAIGTRPGKGGVDGFPGLALDDRGRVAVDPDFRTAVPGVFAGGDLVNGGATITQAVGEGRKAALGMDAHIRRTRTGSEAK